MHAIKCNIVKSNPANAAKDAHVYVLKARDTVFGIQRPILRSDVEPLCKKMAIIAFTSRKDVASFADICNTLQNKGIGLNTGVLESDRLEFQKMERGSHRMTLNVHETPYADLENACIVHAMDLVIFREVTAVLGMRSGIQGLQGIEVSYDAPSTLTSIRVLNRLYNR